MACTGPTAAQNLALSGDRDGVGRLIDLDHMLSSAAGDAAPATPINLSERHKGAITCVAFSPDGRLRHRRRGPRHPLLGVAKDGKLLNTLNAAHKAAVTSLQFAQQEDKPLRLVSAGGDNTLVVWNLEDLKTSRRRGQGDATARAACCPTAAATWPSSASAPTASTSCSTTARSCACCRWTTGRSRA